jgi:hypothetical protein
VGGPEFKSPPKKRKKGKKKAKRAAGMVQVVEYLPKQV